MASNSGLGWTVLAALGAAAVVFGFLPGQWPNPLPEGPVAQDRSVLRLWAAAVDVDDACARGDVVAFDATVTKAHRERLARELAAVDRPLDGSALKDLSTDRERAYGELLVQPLLAGEVRGKHAVVAVQRPGKDGAQLLTFWWDGWRLRLDDSRHAAAVRTPAHARAAVADAIASRPR